MKIYLKAPVDTTASEFTAAVQAVFLSEFHQWRKMNPHAQSNFKIKPDGEGRWVMTTPFNQDENYFMLMERVSEKDYGMIRTTAQYRIEECCMVAKEFGWGTSKTPKGRFQYAEAIGGVKLAVTTVKVHAHI